MADNKGDFLRYAVMDADVYAMCVQHALSTEKEEIMGLLIGEVDTIHKRSYIKSTMILTRSDKKPDRVEISPEQICTASSYADKLAERMKRPWRVLGWYHSHPHITVWPSIVDLRTQATYQMMDPFFVGLIFSVYQTSGNSMNNSVYICCFQTVRNGSSCDKRCVNLEIAPSSLKSYNLEGSIKLPKILYEEEVKSHDEQTSEDMDNLTRLYNESIKTVELVHIVSYVAKPLAIDLEERLNITKKRIAELEKLKRRLIAQKNQ
ncbi:lys-63-specific deubiquitinase BRCC36-like [Coccinella septempunctata]|uniref:lys-63-specific deubiquitinase BRCC36-like n=1 Tax=Coccinella septempunctata TaxID=41139 RepID=UPI001D066004|nr:lys-63-specific deubiquitinase BRCC36-like [Coccinella septempunctata]